VTAVLVDGMKMDGKNKIIGVCMKVKLKMSSASGWCSTVCEKLNILSSGGRLIFTIFSCEGGTSSFIYLGNRVETGRKSGMNLA